MYKSRFSFLYVYLPLAFALLLFSSGIYFFIRPEVLIKDRASQSPAAGMFGCMLVVMASVLAYNILKRAARIILLADAIQLNYITRHITIPVTAIESIELNARKSRIGLSSSDNYLTGILIIVKGGKEYFLLDLYYSNKAVLKQRIEILCSYPTKIKLVAPATPVNISTGNLNNEDQRFAGSYLLSFNFFGTVFLLVSIVLPFIDGRKMPPTFAAIFISSASLFWIGLSSNQAHYFIIAGNKLLIKNHLFFWKCTMVELSNIRQVFFVERYKACNSLLLVCNDYTTKRYFAGSLRNKNWLEFKEKLESIGIPVQSDFTLYK